MNKTFKVIGCILVIASLIMAAYLMMTPTIISSNAQYSLQNAIFKNNLKQVKKILEESEIDLNNATFYPEPPVAIAVGIGSEEILALLIEHGADIKGIKSPYTLLEIAALKGNEQMIDKLIALGIDLNEESEFGQTALEVVISDNPDPNIVKKLISQGAAVSETILRKAAETGSLELYAYILSNLDCKLESAVDEYGQTILHHAAISGNLEFFKYILGKGQDIYVRTTTGESVLHLSGSKELSKFLLENYIFDINELTRIGETPLISQISQREGALEHCTYLIDKGAMVNIAGSDIIPLFKAVVIERYDLVKLLIDNGADVHSSDLHGDTALHYAITPVVNDESYRIVQFLLSAGANENKKNRDGFSPVDLAKRFNNSAIIKLLEGN
ncbi:MAG TPA: hypothetical protein DG577_06305 [Firmicutes bacterium]|nr:hypothetical protein [Bacillota bacterium]